MAKLDQEFIRTLRQEFLHELEETLYQFREIQTGMETAHHNALGNMLKSAHNMKGNAQGVGYSSIVDILHAFENDILILQRNRVFEISYENASIALDNWLIELESALDVYKRADIDDDPTLDEWKVNRDRFSKWVEENILSKKPEDFIAESDIRRNKEQAKNNKSDIELSAAEDNFFDSTSENLKTIEVEQNAEQLAVEGMAVVNKGVELSDLKELRKDDKSNETEKNKIKVGKSNLDETGSKLEKIEDRSEESLKENNNELKNVIDEPKDNSSDEKILEENPVATLTSQEEKEIAIKEEAETPQKEEERKEDEKVVNNKNQTSNDVEGLHLFEDEEDVVASVPEAISHNVENEEKENSGALKIIPDKNNSEKVEDGKIPDSKTKKANRFLLCTKKSQDYAVNVKYVKEVIEDKQLQRLPIARKGVEGLVVVRGVPLAIIDMKGVFGEDTVESIQTKCIVVCEVGDKQFGFCVDSASRVITLSEEEARCTDLPDPEDISECVSHIATIDDENILFIDVPILLEAA